jgi:uncharacterized protein (DUF1697 family)
MLLFNQKVIKFSVIIIAFLLFSGCAFIQDPLGQKKIEQLRQKAESIFKRQNIASSQVMILTMDEENTILSDAELAMQEACAKLNAYVIRSMSSDVYDNKKTWQKIQKIAMQKDFSWQQSAEQYLALYRTL